MRRWLIALLALLLILAAAFFLLAPGMVERSMNKVDGQPLPAVGEHARTLHRTLTIRNGDTATSLAMFANSASSAARRA